MNKCALYACEKLHSGDCSCNSSSCRCRRYSSGTYVDALDLLIQYTACGLFLLKLKAKLLDLRFLLDFLIIVCSLSAHSTQPTMQRLHVEVLPTANKVPVQSVLFSRWKHWSRQALRHPVTSRKISTYSITQDMSTLIYNY